MLYTDDTVGHAFFQGYIPICPLHSSTDGLLSTFSTPPVLCEHTVLCFYNVVMSYVVLVLTFMLLLILIELCKADLVYGIQADKTECRII